MPLREAGPWQDAPDCSQMPIIVRLPPTAAPEPPLDASASAFAEPRHTSPQHPRAGSRPRPGPGARRRRPVPPGGFWRFPWGPSSGRATEIWSTQGCRWYRSHPSAADTSAAARHPRSSGSTWAGHPGPCGGRIQVDQLGLRRHVGVPAPSSVPQTLPHLAHRHGAEALGVGEFDGGGGDPLDGEALLGAPRRHLGAAPQEGHGAPRVPAAGVLGHGTSKLLRAYGIVHRPSPYPLL